MKLKISIKRQHRNWKRLQILDLPTPAENTIDSNSVINFPFNSNAIVVNQITTCEQNRVCVTSNDAGSYVLSVSGPLWDENIVHLCSQWGQNNQEDLIRACICVQLLQCGIVPSSFNINS